MSVELASRSVAADQSSRDHKADAVRLSFHGRREAPDEVLEPCAEDEYLAFRAQTDWREPHRIPPQYLEGTGSYVAPVLPDTPLIVFINARAGGNLGARLASILYRCLGNSQVFDVSQHRPAAVLKTLWANLLAAEAAGDATATHVRENLRIVVAGGDGTVTWVLGTILELRLQPPPAVAALPLGTGNDLSLNFGWGNRFEWAWVKHNELYTFLKRYKDAEVRGLDCWRVEIVAPEAGLFREMPHSLRQDAADPRRASALFWNYFSIGLDAAAAYDFHALREAHPQLASGRLANQAWYSIFSCTTGWFCGAAPLVSMLRLRTRSAPDGEWRPLPLPSSVRAVVLLNLQSYGGGRDIWGLPNTASMRRKGFVDPIYDDGLMEVVGLRSGWHTAVVMGQVSPKVHAKRLAQCAEVELELVAGASGPVKGETATSYMQLDGEPWPQHVPAEPRPAGGAFEPLRLRVTRAGQSRVLLNAADAQGPKKARQLTVRGSELSCAVSKESAAAGVGGEESAAAGHNRV